MEAQTEFQNYLEQGRQAQAQGQAREAAIAYAHGAQLEPGNPQVHLGLAEANLALQNYGVVQMACHRVQELEPDGGNEAKIAQALLDLLDKRYERALQNVDAVIADDPSSGYVHALRAYLLQANGQDYDAQLARARATRLSFGGKFENNFPPLEKPQPQPQKTGYTGTPTTPRPGTEQARPGEKNTSWSRPNPMQRQMVRTRFELSKYPGIVTYILIAINIIAYIWMLLNQNVYYLGVQNNALIAQGQYWRLVTAMFLHDPTDILHILLNMFSLFMIGRSAELFYGRWRYLTIYLLSGLIGNIFCFYLAPNDLSLGASGAIFGVFGALGTFYLLNRRAMGTYSRGIIMNWLFILLINLGYGFLVPGIAIWAHVGGLLSGLVISYFLIPRSRRGRTFV